MARTYATYEEAREIALTLMDKDDENDIDEVSEKIMYNTIMVALTGSRDY